MTTEVILSHQNPFLNKCIQQGGQQLIPYGDRVSLLRYIDTKANGNLVTFTRKYPPTDYSYTDLDSIPDAVPSAVPSAVQPAPVVPECAQEATEVVVKPVEKSVDTAPVADNVIINYQAQGTNMSLQDIHRINYRTKQEADQAMYKALDNTGASGGLRISKTITYQLLDNVLIEDYAVDMAISTEAQNFSDTAEFTRVVKEQRSKGTAKHIKAWLGDRKDNIVMASMKTMKIALRPALLTRGDLMREIHAYKTMNDRIAVLEAQLKEQLQRVELRQDYVEDSDSKHTWQRQAWYFYHEKGITNKREIERLLQGKATYKQINYYLKQKEEKCSDQAREQVMLDCARGTNVLNILASK